MENVTKQQHATGKDGAHMAAKTWLATPREMLHATRRFKAEPVDGFETKALGLEV